MNTPPESPDGSGGPEASKREDAGGQPYFAEYLDAVLPRLRDMANGKVHERLGHLPDPTLSRTVLVQEAVIVLMDQQTPWQSSSHVLGVASLAMDRLILDYQKRRLAQKRGAGKRPVSLEAAGEVPTPEHKLDAPNEFCEGVRSSISRLREVTPRAADVAALRLAGKTNAEIARTLGVSEPTVERDWKAARRWLEDDLRQMMDDLS